MKLCAAVTGYVSFTFMRVDPAPLAYLSLVFLSLGEFFRCHNDVS